jgi:hypothetical protein
MADLRYRASPRDGTLVRLLERVTERITAGGRRQNSVCAISR